MVEILTAAAIGYVLYLIIAPIVGGLVDWYAERLPPDDMSQEEWDNIRKKRNQRD